MVTISLCMIVKNERETLPRCLDSAAGVADEIIIVDTGSTDGTVEAAGRYTDRVFSFEWCNDFSAARNFAFSKASMDYSMWLDADDVILPGDREALLELKRTLEPDTDVVMMRYQSAAKGALSYYRERLLRRQAGFRWEGAVHEVITPRGKILYSDAAVTHAKAGPGDPERNLRIFEGLIAGGRELSPREQFYYARELTYHGRDGEAAGVFQKFLDSGRGWVENNIEACLNLAACLQRLGQSEEAFSALLRSLRFGEPRAEVCCELGHFFFRREEYAPARFWYERALGAPEGGRSGGFVIPDCHGYTPCIGLCACLWRLGEHAEARRYHERAGSLQPDGTEYLFNKEFFDRTAD